MSSSDDNNNKSIRPLIADNGGSSSDPDAAAGASRLLQRQQQHQPTFNRTAVSFPKVTVPNKDGLEVDDWIKDPPCFSDRAHRITFRSRHHHHHHHLDSSRRRAGWATAVWPVHDLVWSDILRFLRPTHSRTQRIRFGVVLTLLASALLYTLTRPAIPLHQQQQLYQTQFEWDLPSWYLVPAWHFSLDSDVVSITAFRLHLLLCLVWVAGLVLWIGAHRRMLRHWWCDDDKEWMDPTVPARHRLPMHVPLRLWDCPQRARRAACVPQLVAQSLTTYADATTSPKKMMAAESKEDEYSTNNVCCLDSGKWKFALFDTAEQGLAMVQQRQSGNSNNSLVEWKPIPVPSNWTLHPECCTDRPIYTNIQYPWPCTPPLVPEGNPTGVYRLEFALPCAFHTHHNDQHHHHHHDSDEYTLLFHGVESAYYVYLNQQFIGFAKDSRLPSEFDVTHALNTTNNLLEVVVMRWSDGSYLEDQDQWWMAGIHRSVELIRRPVHAHVVDYAVQADATGHLNVYVECRRRQRPLTTSRQQRYRISTELFKDEALDADGRAWKPGSSIWRENHEFSSKNIQNCNLSGDVPSVSLWTAETPHLYTLVITLEVSDSDNNNDEHWTVAQAESCRVGFRTVDICDGAVHVNGQEITVCGMNRHEHDPDHGKVVSLERMKQDICLLKQNNFNLVRTSHYPTHSSFYRLCDFYGLYVWDEANIETHGMKPMGRLTHDPGWRKAFVSRVTRMVQRDRNHPSIILWSLGNESGRGRNLWEARRLVQELDPSRPVCYESGGACLEGTGRTELTDVVCTMYPDVPRTLRLARRHDEDRPVILCEYSHAMGNSNGNLHYYWDAFWDKTIPRLQGGCIWDFVDQGLRIPDTKNGDGYYFAYGGDFGDKVNDLQFCINGMFSPDREPHPAVSEIKFLQQPVLFSSVPAVKGNIPIRVPVQKNAMARLSFKVENRFSFQGLNHIAWSWMLKSNRSTEVIRSERFHVRGGRQQTEELVELRLDSVVSRVRLLEKSKPLLGNSYFLLIRGELQNDTSWAHAGHVVVTYQFCIDFDFGEAVGLFPSPVAGCDFSSASERLETVSKSDSIEVYRIIRGKACSLASFCTESGALKSYSPQGQNVLRSPLLPNFVRAATDNDKGGLELALGFFSLPALIHDVVLRWKGTSKFSHFSQWKMVGLDGPAPVKVECPRIRITSASNSAVVGIVALIRVFSPDSKVELFKVKHHYTLFDDGRIRISCVVVPQLGPLQKVMSLPRVGLTMQLEPKLYNIQYFGRGPGENYPDRKAGSELGIYKTTPSDMPYLKYIVPGENGSRSDCEYVAFRSDDGEGFLLASTLPSNALSTFSCSAQLHSISELHQALHTCDLARRQNGEHAVHVNIDHRLMGLGGDTSWYPVVYPEFLVKPNTDYRYDIWLLPLQKEDQSSYVARNFLAYDHEPAASIAPRK